MLQAAGDIKDDKLALTSVLSALDYAHATLTNAGNNSWLGMLRQNATMTMESWTQPPFQGDVAACTTLTLHHLTPCLPLSLSLSLSLSVALSLSHSWARAPPSLFRVTHLGLY